MANTNNVIVCPYCYRKYSPSEIFVPSAFFGKSVMVNDDVIGKGMDLSESYTCDDCNQMFTITAEVSFNCKKTTIGNFEEEYFQRK